MAKKRKQRKIKRKKLSFTRLTQAQRQIVAVVLIIIAIILFLGLFELAGVAGEFLILGLEILFGRACWFIPIIFIIAGLFAFNYPKIYDQSTRLAKKVPSFGARFIGLIFLIIILAGAFHIPFINDLSTTFETRAAGGGYIGYGLSYLLIKTFGFWASWVICIGLFIIVCIIIFTGIFKTKSKQEKILTKERFIHRMFRGLKTLFKRKKEVTVRPEEVMDKLERAESSLVKSTSQDGSRLLQELGKKGEIDISPVKIQQKIDLPLNLLESDSTKPSAGDIKANKLIIKKTLENFSIPVEMGEIKVGPTVTQYTLKPEHGIKLSQITTLHNDLAMALAAHPIRIEAPIPGRSLVGIEVPNQRVAIIRLKDILASETFKKRISNLTIALGRDVAGRIWLADLGKMPHLLVAGATGSGKSIFLKSVLISLLYQNSPADLRFILMDPKRVELTLFEDLPHLLTPVIMDITKTINALKWALSEMERRFDIMHEAKKRDINTYNQSQQDKLPYIIIIIDELADLMVAAPQEVEGCIIRLAQMARATGIHLVMATQRPSVDIITGLIKANITSRLAFSVASIVDSRTILDFGGAEKLLGRGDMLFISPEISKPKRLQGAYVSDQEIKKTVDYLKNLIKPSYEEEVIEPQVSDSSKGWGKLKQDEMLPQAREVVIQAGKASASFLQRRLRIGYARAARLLDLLEEEGTIGPPDGAKPREVYKESLEHENI